MAKRRVTPPRRKPLRAEKKGPPPKVAGQGAAPCCGSRRVLQHQGSDLAYCQMCGTVLLVSENRLRIPSMTTAEMRLARPELSSVLDDFEAMRAEDQSPTFVLKYPPGWVSPAAE